MFKKSVRWLFSAASAGWVGVNLPSIGAGAVAAALAGLAGVKLTDAPWPLVGLFVLGVFLLFSWVVAQIVIRVVPAVPLATVQGNSTAGSIATDPAGPRAPERVNDPTVTYFRQRSIRITDLAETTNNLNGITFEECIIHGPAMLAPLAHVTIGESRLLTADNGRIDDLLFEVQVPRLMIGCITLTDCVFRRCTFFRVGFVGTSAFLTQLRLNTVTPPVVAQSGT